MSKQSKYEQLINVVNEFSCIGEERGMIRLFTEDKTLNGRKIQIQDEQYVNFGSFSYLGLELNARLKKNCNRCCSKFWNIFFVFQNLCFVLNLFRV